MATKHSVAAPDEAPDVDDGRHFVNELADFAELPRAPEAPQLLSRTPDGAWRLSDAFRQRVRRALDQSLADALPELMSLPASDRSVYTGKAGVAYLLWHLARCGLPDSSRSSGLMADARGILADLQRRVDCRRPSFLCGDAGVLALTAVLHWGPDRTLATRSLRQLLAMADAAARPEGPPNELLYGRAGYLFALAFVAWQLRPQGLPEAARRDLAEAARPVARRALEEGARLWRERRGSGPGLLFEWHDSVYFGAAHGLSGIIAVLSRVLPSLLPQPELQDFGRRAEATVSFLRRRQFSSRNFPSSLGSERDRLVHWCHGAPAFALMFIAMGDLPAALQCGSVVWRRGLLHKGDGLCHGVAGNAYVFLRLHRATGDPRHLHRAAAFAQFMLDFRGPRRVPDRPLSLFEGLAGKLCFLADLLRADDGEQEILFPAAELPEDFAF